MLALAELSEELGSKASEAMLAVLVGVPWLCGCTTISIVTVWPLVSVPSGQVTVPLDSEQLPCEGVAESKVTLPGRVSVTWTFVAVEGPAL